jgi:predicted permease
MGQVARDIRYTVTLALRNKNVALIAVTTIALGVAATAFVFSLAYGVLLKPLPYPHADRLVRVWEEHPGGTPITADRWISNRTFWAWTERPRTIEVLGGFGTHEYTLGIGPSARRAYGAEVSPRLFSSLSARPIAGRLFADSDSGTPAESVVVLGESLWQEAFGADSTLLGKAISIDGEPKTVIGVMSGEFFFPDRRARFWLPYVVARVSTDPRRRDRTGGLSAIAHLADGSTIAQVEAEGTAAARSVPVTTGTRLLFGSGGPPVVHATPLLRDQVSNVRPALLVLSAAAVCVLLIACFNVANLFLSWNVARERELAIRQAIGAGTPRLVGQLLTEALVLAITGGLLGTVVAYLAIRALPAVAPGDFPRLIDVRIDGLTLAISGLATLSTALMAAVTSAIRHCEGSMAGSLRGGNGATAAEFSGRRGRGLRDALLGSEAAFAVMLLLATALLGRSFARLVHVDAGYTADHVLTMRVGLLTDNSQRHDAEFVRAVLDKIRTLPGVRAAGASNMLPLMPVTAMTSFQIASTLGSEPIRTRQRSYTVTSGYAQAIGLRVREGRLFLDSDTGAKSRVIVVNDEFVRRYISGEPVAGRRVSIVDDIPGARAQETTVVGVVHNVLKDGNDRPAEPEVYFPQDVPSTVGAVNFAIRSDVPPASLVPAVRNIVQQADGAAAIEDIQPLSEKVSSSMAQPRFVTMILTAFALTALVLAAVGLYGVLSYAVGRRRRELCVRAALGASRADLLALVLREGLWVTLVGLAAGLLGSIAMTRFLRSLLFGIGPLDSVSFVAAPTILLAVAVMACLWPALRAARTEPAEAFRAQQ